MPAGERIEISVILAWPTGAVSRQYSMGEGSTVADALTRASAEPAFAGSAAAGMPVGIFGRVVQPNQPLQDGDRVELYRPLAEDPKTARRQRARTARRRQ